MANTVNEKSPLYLTLDFKDENGDPLVPTTVEWRLDNKASGAEIVAWTSLGGLAATMVHLIVAGNHIIGAETNIKEERIFGLRINDGLISEAHTQYEYSILNLLGPAGA